MCNTRYIFAAFETIDENTLSSIPEIVYLFCVVIEDCLSPQQFTGTAAVTSTLLLSIATIWNFIDGVCSILEGMTRLSKAREAIFSMSLLEFVTSETFWGVCNILDGIQLVAIAIASFVTGAIALAAISFAIAMLHDLMDLGVRLNQASKEDKNYKQLQCDFFFKFFSCTGMALLAFAACTPASLILLLGTALCTGVASYYAGKHLVLPVINAFSCCPGFFSSHSKSSSSVSATNSQLPRVTKLEPIPG